MADATYAPHGLFQLCLLPTIVILQGPACPTWPHDYVILVAFYQLLGALMLFYHLRASWEVWAHLDLFVIIILLCTIITWGVPLADRLTVIHKLTLLNGHAAGLLEPRLVQAIDRLLSDVNEGRRICLLSGKLGLLSPIHVDGDVILDNGVSTDICEHGACIVRVAIEACVSLALLALGVFHG